jgi:hypothetical protein
MTRQLAFLLPIALVVSCGSNNFMPASLVTTAPRGTLDLGPFAPSGAVFTFAENASGGTLTPQGTYTAGSHGNVLDRVTGKKGSVTATIEVNVGAELTVFPPMVALPPLGTVDFAASGGSESGFAFSLPSGSNGTMDGSLYRAGSSGPATDTVQVTDSLGNMAQAHITVGGSAALSPATASVPPRGSVSFNVSGGSGPFVFALSSNASGGSINPVSGAYTAGPLGSVTDVVTATDSLGNSTSASVAVGASLTISPGSVSVRETKQASFAAAGGAGPYVFSLSSNQSGQPTIVTQGPSGATGLYTPGAVLNTVDTVTVTDANGNTANATVEVVPYNAQVQLVSLGGATTGTFTLTYQGQTTAALPANATAAQVRVALDGLPTIGGVGGTVTVSQSEHAQAC